MQGRIIENIANLYKVEVNNNEYICTARGKIKNEDIIPVVGDIVQLDIISEEKKEAVIDKIFPRTNYIKRPKLANITQIIFVVSSNDPKPDLLMLDKQLAFAEFLNLKSLIVLNKTDLDKKQEFKNIKNVYENIGYKVIETDAKHSFGIDKLEIELNNNLSAFSGNSGVRKIHIN